MKSSVMQRSLYLFLALLATVAMLPAQTETGQITGSVTDPSGAIVPSAQIRLTSTTTGAMRNTTSTGAGAYTFSNLLPGEYTVIAEVPSFSSYKQNVTLTVGARVGLDIHLQVGQVGTTVQVSEAAVQVNTETQTLTTNVSETQLKELPTLTRNPYDLVALSGNVSDAGAGNRGVGFNINGQRQDSTNVLLDGAANNDEFSASVGQSVPLDSVQEYSVLTNNFTAEFGRAAGGVVNVVTKSGTNGFHGTAYEFNRVSKLSSNSFDNNANGIGRSVFTRNQFGYSLGGPIIKDKLFFFSSTEWTRIRSVATDTAFVPTSNLLSLTAPNTQSFFSTYGALKPGTSVLQSYSAGTFAASGINLCGTKAACNNLGTSIPLFNKVAYQVAGDAGGGNPANEYETVVRVDYNLSDKTQMYGRYALQSTGLFAGTVSASPYAGFDSGENDFDNNALFSITHTFSASFISQSKAVFNRLNKLQPFGASPAVPTLYTGSAGALSLLGTQILFPGYDPGAPGSGIPFGGPQNFVQLYQDFSLNRGKHDIRFGGSFDYERDNRTFGAYETAGEYLGSGSGTGGSTVAGLLNGTLYGFQVAINPQGMLPGQTVSYPLSQPNFSRSNRYNEGAVYVQDSWKVSKTFTANIGVRWEHFGVQHNKNQKLDSNFYDPANQVDTPLGIRLGSVQLAPNSPPGQLWKPDWHDFGPRLGFAWDVLGDGKTSLRGGWGIGYIRNFGNVTFNAIQNPPNYETVSVLNQNVPISASNLGPFAASTGSLTLPKASLRNIDPNIRTAYTHNWSTSLEHQFGNNTVFGVDYTGSRGVHLYDIQILNRAGYGNVFLGDPCSAAAGTCTNYLNPQFSGINRRGDRGWSNYNGVNVRYNINDISHLGLTLTFAYTWSHAEDNLSSSFTDSNAIGGDNNGNFNTGYLDPYAPMLDKGSSDFDIRHRVTVTAIYAIPFFKNGNGILHQAVGGWEIAPIFTARSGSPYSIFDGTNGYTDYPRAAFTAAVPVNGNGTVSNGAPNSFNYLTFNNSIVDHFANPTFLYSDLPPFPTDMTGRNAFREPGFYNLNLGLYKTFSIKERFKLQLRGESYNLLNHANLYLVGSGAEISGAVGPGTTSITACRGCTGTTQDRRNIQLAAKFIF